MAGVIESLLFSPNLFHLQLVKVKATCSRQGDTCPTCPSQGCLSEATCPRQSCLSESRLLLFRTCQVCLSTTACPSQGYLSMTCLLMATFQVKAARQRQSHLSKAGCRCGS